jgi:hypothetical protein
LRFCYYLSNLRHCIVMYWQSPASRRKVDFPTPLALGTAYQHYVVIGWWWKICCCCCYSWVNWCTCTLNRIHDSVCSISPWVWNESYAASSFIWYATLVEFSPEIWDWNSTHTTPLDASFSDSPPSLLCDCHRELILCKLAMSGMCSLQ